MFATFSICCVTKSRRLAAAMFLMASVPALFGQEDKLAPDLAGVGAEETVDVIIQLEEEPAGRGTRRGLAWAGLAGGLNLSAHRPVKELGLIGGVSARVNGAGLQALARDRRVKYVSPDREVGGDTAACDSGGECQRGAGGGV
ncbi:MAG: hypothetical protein NTX13_16870 [Acidobacteria bacterium]|nr:hypothetical protein [Acidobacteriota bacterium]